MGVIEMSGDPKAFWNAKAHTFPRFSEGEDTYEAGMLRTARENGVTFAGKRILDVGCGSGMYTLRLAMEAQHVTAVDISSEMLRILEEDAQARGVSNISTVQSGWDDFQTEEQFEVVFASMTPAIHDDASRDKLLRCISGWGIYMGFSDVIVSNVMADLFTRHDITPRIFNNVRHMREWLARKGIAYTAIPVTGEWVVPKSWDAIVHSTTITLQNYGVEPDDAELARHLETFRDEAGTYTERTPYSLEMILWRYEAA